MKLLCLLFLHFLCLIWSSPTGRSHSITKRAVCPCLLFEYSPYMLLFSLNYFFLIFAHLHSLNLTCHRNLHSVLKALPTMVILKLIAYANSECVVFHIFRIINNLIYINVLSRAFACPFRPSLHLPNCMSA